MGKTVINDRFLWKMWWLGTILTVLSWTGKISYTIGWIGFGMACLSSLISVIKRKAWVPPPDDE